MESHFGPMDEPTLSALAFGQPLWAPDEAHAEPDGSRFPRGPERSAPRGNGAVHEADLARGQEQFESVLGW